MIDERPDPERLRIRSGNYCQRYGRRPRILLICRDLCCSRIRIKSLAVDLADFGFDVDAHMTVETIDGIVRITSDNDVQSIGVADVSAGADAFAIKLHEALTSENLDNVLIVVWTSEPSRQSAAENGFSPEWLVMLPVQTDTATAVEAILDRLENRSG